MATRLIRGWTHLERQRGGSIGLRGPGETQLETDRRLLQKRLEQLQVRLDKVQVQRTQQRRARVRSELPRVALVGYTNAGKSTLFNALTGAGAQRPRRPGRRLCPARREQWQRRRSCQRVRRRRLSRALDLCPCRNHLLKMPDRRTETILLV